MHRGQAVLLLGVVALNAAVAGPVVPVVDGAGAPLANAVVYLTPAEGPVVVTSTRYLIDQRDKRFEPLISVVQAGTTVEFPNSDNIRHHVYSFSPAKVFNLKLYSGRAAAPVTFTQPGVVTLGCNIHDHMVAWIVVAPSPWYARTGADGMARLPDVPPGSYSLEAWHPGLATPLAPTSIRISASDTTLPALTLTAGPVPMPVPGG